MTVTPLARIALLAPMLLVAGCSQTSPGVGAAGLPAAAPTVDAATRTTPVVTGRPARVFVFAGVGKKCEALPEPEIKVTAPPGKGDLALKPGQETTMAATAQGTCLGAKARGTGVYYTARAGQLGTDRFTVEAKLASGEIATRSFEVTIAE